MSLPTVIGEQRLLSGNLNKEAATTPINFSTVSQQCCVQSSECVQQGCIRLTNYKDIPTVCMWWVNMAESIAISINGKNCYEPPLDRWKHKSSERMEWWKHDDGRRVYSQINDTWQEWVIVLPQRATRARGRWFQLLGDTYTKWVKSMLLRNSSYTSHIKNRAHKSSCT